MQNMFTDLAKQAPTAKAKKNDKPVIRLQGDDIDANVKSFAELKKQADEIKTKMTLVQGFIKDVTLQKWYDLYKNNGAYPGSCLVTTDSDSSFTFMPSDKYLTIDADTAQELKDKYGDGIVTEDITYSFNSAALMRNAETLTALIQGSPDISDADKANLIEVTKKISVSKGSIEKALTVGKGDVKTFCDDIRPVFGMRTPQIK